MAISAERVFEELRRAVEARVDPRIDEVMAVLNLDLAKSDGDPERVRR